MNETDYFEPDWQHSFWGENYPRLLAIKRKYDPRNLFRMIATGALKVSINQRFLLRQASDAHRELEARRTTGSTILLP